MKKALIFAVSAFAAIMTNADVMMWQVADDNLSGYSTATLYSIDKDQPNATPVALASTDLYNGRGYERQISLDGINTSGTYFYIEVGKYSDSVYQAYQSGEYSYSDLVSAGLISTGSMNTPSGYSFGDSTNPNTTVVPQYSAVPEPGTAGLILLGLAVAGLKRRRV